MSLPPIIERQIACAKERGIDALVSMSPENSIYTGGFQVPSQNLIRSRLVMCLVCQSGSTLQIVADMEESFTRSMSVLEEVRAYNEFTTNPADALADALVERGLSSGTIGIELDYVPAFFMDQLKSRLPKARFIDVGPILGRLRSVKTPAEIATLTRVGQMAEEAHQAVAAGAKPGMTEMDLALILYDSLLRQGAEGIARIVVGSGIRSTHANPGPTDRRLLMGDVVRVDIYALVNSYLSDVARTYTVGRATPDQKALWRKLVDSQRYALDMVKPGVNTADIYEDYSHRCDEMNLKPLQFLGHGLGLTLHEDPYIGKYGPTVLEEGMVLCIEPYVTYPGFGFQIEDEIIVTSDGYRAITGDKYPVKDLFEIV